MKSPRVLIVDDDALFANLVKRTLLKKYDVKIAPDVWSGMEAMDDFRPDVVVLDILMPAANGLSFLQEIMSYADTAKVPVLVCTSAASQMNADYLRQAGVVHLIDKSTMQPTDIADYVAEALNMVGDDV